MIHLKSIELVNFKGVSRLSCDFDDLTVLAGLNNSGKTTVLQAVYLLLGSLPRIAAHQHIDHPNLQTRVVSLDSALTPLGVRDNLWLSSVYAPEVQGTICGVFANELRLELGVFRNAGANFTFTVSQRDAKATRRAPRELVGEVAALTAAFLTPPGEVPSRENMVNGDQYTSSLRQGMGSQLWRNGIWWGIQSDGFESFAPVQKKIATYFPDIELLLPTLSISGAPEILIKYREKGRGPLDIAQSGAGLRTFVSLTRILDQSSAEVILLDEPDAHLHASQQAVILDLMLDVASRLGRQVIIASHSPEIITRVPSEALRWIERDSTEAQGGEEVGRLLERLGASPDTYISRSRLPAVLIYVEGVKDRPILESLVKWCRNKTRTALPDTLVIPHRDGRFEGPTLHGISRFARQLASGILVVGIRDLDWYYQELPGPDIELGSGEGWSLITLPCKEMENLLCDPDFLAQAYEGKLSNEQLESLLDEESGASELVEEWQYQVRPRVRKRMPTSLDDSTRERDADAIFNGWAKDPSIRRRMVAGKSLLGRVRNRIRREHGLSFYPARAIEKAASLPSTMLAIAKQIFPGLPVDGSS
jgi:hypothetical protein